LIRIGVVWPAESGWADSRGVGSAHFHQPKTDRYTQSSRFDDPVASPSFRRNPP
jgi:hypothetical protein